MEWQPIDTAPKDGTVFDVPPDSGYTQAFWQDGFWWWYNTETDSLAAGPEPKGWKPLPSNVVSKGRETAKLLKRPA